MRDRVVSVDFTPREVLINSETLYLASYIMKNPDLIKDDKMALEAVVDLLGDIESWKEYCLKMHEICVLAQTTKGT